jgi:hypothetical protein
MAQTEIRVQLPDEVAALLGTAEEAAVKARMALVLDLLRAGRIGQGKAASVLGLSRHAMIDLLAAHDIASGPQTLEEYHRDLDDAEPFVRVPAS